MEEVLRRTLQEMSDRELAEFVGAIQRTQMVLANVNKNFWTEKYPDFVMDEVRRRQEERGISG
jgi:hypothetical protein